MTNRIVRFDDFSGGHWGIRDQSNVGRNMWFGSNIQVYPSGLIGPRAGLKSLTPPGTPPAGNIGTSIHRLSDGKGMVIYSNNDTNPRFTFDAQTLVRTGTATGTATTGGVTAAHPGWGTIADSTSGSYTTILYGPGVFIYRLTGSTFATTDISGTVGSIYGAVRWRDRIVGILGGNNGKVVFSNAGAYTTFAATNVFTVGGDGGTISWLYPDGDVLYVGTESAIYSVTGVLGATTTVRHVAPLPVDVHGTQGPTSYAVMPDRRIAFAARMGSVKVPISRPDYAFFNGSSVDHETFQTDVFQFDQTNANSPFYSPAVAPAGDGALYYNASLITASQFVLPALRRRLSGGSEIHSFNLGSGVAPDIQTLLWIGPGGAVSQVDRGNGFPVGVFFCWEAAASTPKIAYWDAESEGPTQGDVTAASVLPASLRFPTTYTQNDRLLKVRTVVINGRYYRNDLTFSSGTPAITMRAGATGFNGISDTGQATRYSTSVTVNPQLSSTTQDDFVARVHFGDGSFGEGAFLDITQITNCAIRSVMLVLDESASISG